MIRKQKLLRGIRATMTRGRGHTPCPICGRATAVTRPRTTATLPVWMCGVCNACGVIGDPVAHAALMAIVNRSETATVGGAV